MENDFDLKSMDKKIQLLKEVSEDILEEADNFPSLSRNCRRILASIKMMELNVSDIEDPCSPAESGTGKPGTQPKVGES